MEKPHLLKDEKRIHRRKFRLRRPRNMGHDSLVTKTPGYFFDGDVTYLSYGEAVDDDAVLLNGNGCRRSVVVNGGVSLIRSRSESNLSIASSVFPSRIGGRHVAAPLAVAVAPTNTLHKCLRVLGGSWKNLFHLGGMSRAAKPPQAKKVAPPAVPGDTAPFRNSGSSFGSAGYSSAGEDVLFHDNREPGKGQSWIQRFGKPPFDRKPGQRARFLRHVFPSSSPFAVVIFRWERRKRRSGSGGAHASARSAGSNCHRNQKAEPPEEIESRNRPAEHFGRTARLHSDIHRYAVRCLVYGLGPLVYAVHLLLYAVRHPSKPNQEPVDVLNDIGNMLANLTDELDAMLEEEKRQGLTDD
ncbi:unnamed protein product [Nesidiocoris tenuis]|uniref:Uncharacterized protein n=1 Tax=Nesidiocoris tenuis TaxID=355587 RepID=A0A6H5G705_9HEMI|nr:unnamed protein product [Nesidiocoris tenuis]